MIKVLVVEDFQLIRLGIKQNLQSIPDVEIVGETDNTHDAVKKALELKPDIVLMDLKLGEDNFGGITAAKKIKEKLSHTRILILSFYDDAEYISQAIDARVDGYLLKDVADKELANAIYTISKGKAAISPVIASKMMSQMAEQGKISQKKKEILNILSSREIETFKLLAQGSSNKDIANKLFISEATVKAHISSILRKLDVTDRTQAAILALKYEIFAES